MALLDILNAKYSGEVQKDPTKQVFYYYSKFSPVEASIPKNKVYLKDMLTLVQTNLLKLFIDLKEKDRIYEFFHKYNKSLFIEQRELEDFIAKTQPKDEPINSVVLALVNEYIDEHSYLRALEIW
jgi:hypothetical protein